MRYLTDEWFQSFTESLAAATVGEELPQDRITIEYVIDRVPADVGAAIEGSSIRYALDITNDGVRLERSPGSDHDVRFQQPYDTAVAVASGTRCSADAVVAGEIAVSGDPRLLTAVVDTLRSVASPPIG